MANTPDENRYEAFRDAHLFIEPKTECCDVCLCQKEDCRISCDMRGFVCPDCLKNGDALEFFLANHTEQEVERYFESLKIIK